MPTPVHPAHDAVGMSRGCGGVHVCLGISRSVRWKSAATSHEISTAASELYIIYAQHQRSITYTLYNPKHKKLTNILLGIARNDMHVGFSAVVVLSCRP
jgi:hypothetical protein